MFGRGLCSDDTEHTQMVGRAMAVSEGDAGEFERELARQLKRWLLTAPAGIGFATLRACTKLLLGIGPRHSGVFSAGNGPAMRAALIGVCAESDWQVKEFVRCGTRITHTDPKAEEGALLIARAARIRAHGLDIEPIAFLGQMVEEIEDDELRNSIRAAFLALNDLKKPSEYADSQGWNRGVSGYVNQTVPAALYCWASSPADFRRCVEDAVLLGGDTDSVAAIAGAVCGANLGSDNIPRDWVNRLSEWPRTNDWMQQLATALTQTTTKNKRETLPPMHWLATIPRNAVFAAMVLSLACRRLLPPY